MRKTIALDFDDVVGDLVKTWLELYNRDHNDSLKEEDIKDWNIGSYTKIGNEMYDYLKNPTLYDSVLPVTGASWGISKLRQFGFRIVFVTNSVLEQSGNKYRWLEKYNLISERRDYVEAADKSLILCDWLIDDNIENVVKFKGDGIIFTREWNTSLKGYLRVNGWIDIVNYFDFCWR